MIEDIPMLSQILIVLSSLLISSFIFLLFTYLYTPFITKKENISIIGHPYQPEKIQFALNNVNFLNKKVKVNFIFTSNLTAPATHGNVSFICRLFRDTKHIKTERYNYSNINFDHLRNTNLTIYQENTIQFSSLEIDTKASFDQAGSTVITEVITTDPGRSFFEIILSISISFISIFTFVNLIYNMKTFADTNTLKYVQLLALVLEILGFNPFLLMDLYNESQISTMYRGASTFITSFGFTFASFAIPLLLERRDKHTVVKILFAILLGLVSSILLKYYTVLVSVISLILIVALFLRSTTFWTTKLDFVIIFTQYIAVRIENKNDIFINDTLASVLVLFIVYFSWEVNPEENEELSKVDGDGNVFDIDINPSSSKEVGTSAQE